ncbi:hypothetical protein AMAG_04770 [Allomyces macrogynus ATCC 38327]|uniref:Nicotinamide N-methyltransferase n=1 Tax=Allomyces macrogynus (strain ATCC 38327) TaxID=578462 RepID=A0A0L0S652_ALLM3|nr:hypothetical protein, variant [Allomyces macrogynus ATCC 38327]KNE57931.1 hypothetical protein AMAG_04770 [Allomyces macrogynus ATCC 38327]|eukprot:KNE57930.1 hypothetical protein, variant [Allomyces macrogynus ATCC 38327]
MRDLLGLMFARWVQQHIGTDYPDWSVLELAEANIQRHLRAVSEKGEQTAECSVEALDRLCEDLGPLPTDVDLILASDVVYQDHLMNGFLFTLHSLLTANPSAKAFICAEKRCTTFVLTSDLVAILSTYWACDRSGSTFTRPWTDRTARHGLRVLCRASRAVVRTQVAYRQAHVRDDVLAAGGRIDEFAALDGKEMVQSVAHSALCEMQPYRCPCNRFCGK